VGLVIVGVIIITVPFLASFALDAVSLLALVFDPVTCISIANNIAQVPFILISVVLLRGSDAAGRVPTWSLVVVTVLAQPFVSALWVRVLHGSCIQHGLQALDLRVGILIVLRQQGRQLVDNHP
jgi:hypothetical protein